MSGENVGVACTALAGAIVLLFVGAYLVLYVGAYKVKSKPLPPEAAENKMHRTLPFGRKPETAP